MSLIYPLGPAGSVNIGSAAYTAQGVRFNGSTMLNTSALTGIVDGQKGILSFWFKFVGGDGNFQVLIETNDQNSIEIYRNNSNRWNAQLGTPAIGTAVSWVGSTTYTSSMTQWVHFLSSWDTSGSGAAAFYVSDVVNTVPTFSGGSTINYLPTNTSVDFGARSGLAIPLNCDIADFYLNTVDFLDLSVTANRRKFIDGSGKPVDLGTTGSTPTGNTPIIFLSGSVASWHTNKGSGGSFSVTSGSLSASATNP